MFIYLLVYNGDKGKPFSGDTLLTVCEIVLNRKNRTISCPNRVRTLPEPYPVRTKSNSIDTEQTRFGYGSGHDLSEI